MPAAAPVTENATAEPSNDRSVDASLCDLCWCDCVLSACISGCGGAYDAAVSGKVTIDGKSCQMALSHIRPWRAAGGLRRIEENGKYTIRTGREDGLPAGEYQVTVTANEPSKTLANSEAVRRRPASRSHRLVSHERYVGVEVHGRAGIERNKLGIKVAAAGGLEAGGAKIELRTAAWRASRFENQFDEEQAREYLATSRGRRVLRRSLLTRVRGQSQKMLGAGHPADVRSQLEHDRGPHGRHLPSWLRADVAAAAAIGPTAALLRRLRRVRPLRSGQAAERNALRHRDGLQVEGQCRAPGGRDVNPDFIPNHNGFGNRNDANFVALGGYPGFVLTLPNSPQTTLRRFSRSGDWRRCRRRSNSGQLAGLIDIAQEKNHQFIRHPIAAGNPNNIPAGTTVQQAGPEQRAVLSRPGLGRHNGLSIRESARMSRSTTSTWPIRWPATR